MNVKAHAADESLVYRKPQFEHKSIVWGQKEKTEIRNQKSGNFNHKKGQSFFSRKQLELLSKKKEVGKFIWLHAFGEWPESMSWQLMNNTTTRSRVILLVLELMFLLPRPPPT